MIITEGGIQSSCSYKGQEKKEIKRKEREKKKNQRKRKKRGQIFLPFNDSWDESQTKKQRKKNGD